jgi:hypothetical protein
MFDDPSSGSIASASVPSASIATTSSALFRGVPAHAGPRQRGGECLVRQDVQRLLRIPVAVRADIGAQRTAQRAQRNRPRDVRRDTGQRLHRGPQRHRDVAILRLQGCHRPSASHGLDRRFDLTGRAA